MKFHTLLMAALLVTLSLTSPAPARCEPDAYWYLELKTKGQHETEVRRLMQVLQMKVLYRREARIHLGLDRSERLIVAAPKSAWDELEKQLRPSYNLGLRNLAVEYFQIHGIVVNAKGMIGRNGGYQGTVDSTISTGITATVLPMDKAVALLTAMADNARDALVTLLQSTDPYQVDSASLTVKVYFNGELKHRLDFDVHGQG